MTLSALGIFSAAGAGGGEPVSAYELIETKILGTATSEVVFSSLATYASTYKHLQLRTVFKNTTGTTWSYSRFNGDTASNYGYHELRGNGSTVSSFSGTPETYMNTGVFGTGWGSMITDILDPYSTTKNKTIRTLKGVIGSDGVQLTSGLWRSTASVTSFTLTSGANNFDVGSRFSLYGIKG